MERIVAVKINGNRGAQQEISVSKKVSIDIAPFQQKFPFQEYYVKNDPTGHLKSGKKIRLRLPVLLGIRLRLHPQTSDSLRLRNPALNRDLNGADRGNSGMLLGKKAKKLETTENNLLSC